MTERILRQVLACDQAKVAGAAHRLTRSEQGLLRLIDGVRTLAQVVAMSPLPPADTLDAIARLGKEGLVRPRGSNGDSFAMLEDGVSLAGDPDEDAPGDEPSPRSVPSAWPSNGTSGQGR